MGKILECGTMASTPGTTSDCMMGYLRDDYFIVEPTNPNRKCIPSTVAAHTLYEKSSPLHIIGSEGVVDVTRCKFEQYSERAVKVENMLFISGQLPIDPKTGDYDSTSSN